VFLGARWEDGFEAGCGASPIIEGHRDAGSAEATTPSSPGKSAKRVTISASSLPGTGA